ncbi:MAG: malto-oligosyltrehalose trehalohydrolase [Micavibrio sp.]|nr:malto-oligosyltrehalose trehalohydrolase [Micavibrio sp.]
METMIYNDPRQRIGANYIEGEGVQIRLWAPLKDDVRIIWNDGVPEPLARDDEGYYTGFFPAAKPGDRYIFTEGENRFADPASRYQPEGSFSPSAVVPQAFAWSDKDWRGIPFSEWVIYEIHVGTFSETCDFKGVIADLPRLKDLGITTLEIMPVSQFSGCGNWGYDGVFPHAVQNSYGGPDGFKALIDAAHAQGMAVILDVVYNHIGPEGNTLFACAPYTQTKYKTPWGDALNYDGEHSHHVRRYFLQSVWQWLTEYHLDGLRLDAVQTIFDTSAIPFLEELSALKAEAKKMRKQSLILIAETDANDSRILAPISQNGFGLDAQWADDLHHALHAILTGERNGYYEDYGDLAQLARIYERGVAFEGQISPFRHRHHGRSYEGVDKKRLIVESQNHDQVGNRMKGERLSMLVEEQKLKLAAACILLSPFTPFIFMGEEFTCRKPFLYFTSHSDEKLNEAMRKSRAEEWKSFGWDEEPPDPSDTETFNQCILSDGDRAEGAEMQAYYKELIALSKTLRKSSCSVSYQEKQNCIVLKYPEVNKIVVLNFSDKEEEVELAYPIPPFSARVFDGAGL